MKQLSVGVAIVGCLMIASGWADEGRIPIYQPTTITQSGHYIMTRDLLDIDTEVIVIDAPKVTLDLNGHSISHSCCAGPFEGARIRITPGYKEVTIRNGKLTAGGPGILYESAGNGQLRIEAVEMSSTWGGVRATDVSSLDVISCRFSFISSAVLSIEAAFASGFALSGRVIDNVVNNGPGFSFTGLQGGVIRGNGLYGGGINVISGGGNLIEGNTVRGGVHGIVITTSARNHLVRNVISGMGGDGIEISGDGNRIESNTISGAGSRGIRIFSGVQNHVLGNELAGNGWGVLTSGEYTFVENNIVVGSTVGSGLWFNTPSPGTGVYRGNIIRNNVSGPVQGFATDGGGNIP